MPGGEGSCGIKNRNCSGIQLERPVHKVGCKQDIGVLLNCLEVPQRKCSSHRASGHESGVTGLQRGKCSVSL